MSKLALVLAAAFAVTAIPAGVQAAPCKDAKGKFIKCPPAAAKPATPAGKSTPKAARCRDAKGHFIKCK